MPPSRLKTAEAYKALEGIGVILRPRQVAVDLFCESLRGGNEASPLYIPFALTKLGETPWAF